MNDPILGFDEALAMHVAGDGRLRTTIAPGWDVRGNPHGGYLLALAAKAMGSVVTQPHPISIAASYLVPPKPGQADLFVQVIRHGKRQSTAEVRLLQNNEVCLVATATFGSLPDTPALLLSDDVNRPTSLPQPESCLPRSALEAAEGGAINLHDRIDLRFSPRTGWVTGKPSGIAETEGWLRFVDGREPDPLGLLMFSDGFPPSLFEARGRAIGHIPTVQLTTHLFALPAPGWVQGRFRTRVQGGSFLDEDGELWDSQGHLVATTRQLALVRPPGPPTPK